MTRPMILPTRRELMGAAAAGGLLLPTRSWAQDLPPTPVVPPFSKEKADVRDTRFGRGVSADGRAILPLADGAQRVWVDTNAATDGDGLSPDTPFRTEGPGYGALRGGGQLMVAGGSVLTVPLDLLGQLAGPSPAAPTVIQSYDRDAPTNESLYGLLANNVVYNGAEPFIAGGPKRSTAHIAMRGIRFDHSAAERVVLYRFNSGIDWLLFEQCAFIGSTMSLSAARGCRSHVLRQCAFQGGWSGTSHAEGVYIYGNYDTVVEDCIFHHSGWRMSVDRNASGPEGGPTIFNHGLYAAVQSGGILRRCVFVEPSSHGAQLRGNWAAHDNVFIACPLPLLHGGGNDYWKNAPDGVMALSYRNIITIAEDIGPKTWRGSGVDICNTREGSIVEQTLVVGPRRTRVARGISVTTDPRATTPTRVLLERTTNGWSAEGPIPPAHVGRVFVTDRDNITPIDQVAFVDPTRDGLSAARKFGCQTVREFGSKMIADPTRSWALDIADHIRPGFAPRGLKRGQLKGAVRPDGSWNAG